MYKIVRHEALSEVNFLWEIEAPDIAVASQPGQFVMVRLHDGSERVPLTVADFDRERGSITMVIQALGKTTREMRDNYRAGDAFQDFVGPLGLRAARGQGRPCRAGGRRARRGAGLSATARVQGGRQPHHGDHRLPQQGSGVLGRPLRRVLRRSDRLHRRRQLRQAGLRHRGAEGGGGRRPARPRGGDRPAGDDARLCRDHPAIRRQDDGVAQHDHGGRHRHVRLLPRHGGRQGAVRLRRWPRLRRPSGRLRGAAAAPATLRSQERAASRIRRMSASSRSLLFEQGKRSYKKIATDSSRTRCRCRSATRASGPRTSRRSISATRSPMPTARPSAASSAPSRLCIAGCPVGIDIPGFIRQLLVRNFDKALEVIYESNVFPSVCGRVCPQERQCEVRCILRKSKARGWSRWRSGGWSGSSATTPGRRRAEPPGMPASWAGLPWLVRARRAFRCGGPGAVRAATSRYSRRCTWWAACSSTASPPSGCRATSLPARSSG